MDNLVLRGKVWYSDIWVSGKRIQRALSRFKPQAKLMVQEMKDIRRAQKYGGAPKNMSWTFFKERYMQFSKSTKDPQTSYRDLLTFQMIERVNPLKDLSQMTPERLEQIKAKWQEMGKTQSVVTRHVKAVKTAMRKAEDWKFLPLQNWRTVEVTEPAGRIDYYDPPALFRLLELLKQPWQLAAVLMGRCGLRSGEVYFLEWSDVQFEHHRIFFRSKPHLGWKIKGDKSGKKIRVVPINSRNNSLEVYLKRFQRPSGFVLGPDRPKNLDLFYKLMEDAIKDAGVKTHNIGNGTPHILRHTFGSHLAQRGVPLKVIAELMGHSSVKMAEGYSHLSPVNLSEGVGLLPEMPVGTLHQEKSRGESSTVGDSQVYTDGDPEIRGISEGR